MSVTVLLSLKKGATKLGKRVGNGADAPRTLDSAAGTLKSLWTRTRILRKTYQSLSHSTTMKLEERYNQNTTCIGGGRGVWSRRGGAGGREGLASFGMEQDVFLFMIF